MCMQSCVVVCRVRSMMEVAAVIVTACLVDAHALALLPGHCGVLAVWLGVKTLPMTCVRNGTNCSVCNIRSATGYRAPCHVGRVMTCQRTKKVGPCCVHVRRGNWNVGCEEVMVTSDVRDIPQSLPRACNRVLLSSKRVPWCWSRHSSWQYGW